MIPAAIEGANVEIGKDQDEYTTIKARVEFNPDYGCITITSLFELTPDEIAGLQAGAALQVTVLGSAWPPLAINIRQMMVEET